MLGPNVDGAFTQSSRRCDVIAAAFGLWYGFAMSFLVPGIPGALCCRGSLLSVLRNRSCDLSTLTLLNERLCTMVVDPTIGALFQGKLATDRQERVVQIRSVILISG